MSADQFKPPVREAPPAPPPAPVPGAEFIHLHLVAQARRATVALERLGVTSGDRVAVLLPMAPESVVATMACGRLDASRTTLPVGEPAGLLRRHLQESGAHVVITADSCFHHERRYPAKQLIDQAVAGRTEVRTVLVVHRGAGPVPWTPGRDRWWHEALATLGE